MLRRLVRLLGLASMTSALLAGCATPGLRPNATTETSSTNVPTLDEPARAQVDGDAVQTQSSVAAANPRRQPGAAQYGFANRQGSSAALGSVVVTNPIAPRTLDLTEKPDDIWDRVRHGFAIPNLDSPLVAEQQAWYLSHPDYLRRAVDRSSRYLYHVVEELTKRGMPTELALLPFVESAYNPMAYSRAHASGMWQFIPGTGKDYNLKQDWWRDERRDVLASTDAALEYLQKIYEMHGDWHLALASYNWGEGSVKRAIEKNQAAGLPTDYLSLSMPDETRNYVPKLQALKNIVANPDAFGVTLPKIDNEPYFIAVDRNRDIDVRTAARLANMSIEDFKALNPSFNRPVIPGAAATPLLVPADRAKEFRTGLESGGPLATWQAHTVQRKETVERIASRYGMTSAALREVNGLGAKTKVRPGQALLVQRAGPGDVGLRFASFTRTTEPVAVVRTVDRSRRSYTVKRGDTLFAIARRFDVSPDEIRAANRMRGTQVDVGRTLEIPGGAPVAIETVSATKASLKTRSVRATTVRGSAPRAVTKAPARSGPSSSRTIARKPARAR